MLNKIIILVFFNLLFSYSIFNHIRDFKIPSLNYVGSSNLNNNFYNFSNPASNADTNNYIYSSIGRHFNGLLNNEQIIFCLNTKKFNQLNIAVLKSSIDDIYNTTNAWLDDGDGIVDITEIDYDKINTFKHTNLGIIISKPFVLKNLNFGINSKFSLGSVLGVNSFKHSFDLGYYKSNNSFNFGILIKDLLAYSYWASNTINFEEMSIIFGSNFNYKSSFFSYDYNIIKSEYYIGFEYQYNSNISFQLSNSSFERIYLGSMIKLSNFNIGYYFVLPKYKELGTTQKIMIGINKNIFKKLKG